MPRGFRDGDGKLWTVEEEEIPGFHQRTLDPPGSPSELHAIRFTAEETGEERRGQLRSSLKEATERELQQALYRADPAEEEEA